MSYGVKNRSGRHAAGIVAVLLGLLLCAAPGGAASLVREAGVEQAKAQAATTLREGRYQDAYRMFMTLMREAPDDDAVNRGLAAAASAVGEHNQAILALERLVDKYPRDEALRLELARELVKIGDAGAARREIELARRYNPALSFDIGEAVVNRLQTELSRWQVRGRLSAGLVYDSNTNQGPDTRVFPFRLGGLSGTLTLDPSVVGHASWGAYAAGALDVSWRVGQDSPWWLVGDMAMYRKGYFSDNMATNREMWWGRAAAGIRHIGTRSMVDVRFKTDAVDYIGDDQVAFNNGLEGTFVWGVTPSVQLITRAGVDRRDYDKTNGRQGWYWWAGEYLRVLYGEKNHDIMIGGRWLRTDTEESRYESDGWELSARNTWKLPHDVEFTPFVSFRKEFYDAPATALETRDRKDDIWRLGAALVWNINGSFAWDVTYAYTDSDSTSRLYTYDQHLVSTGVTWKF